MIDKDSIFNNGKEIDENWKNVRNLQKLTNNNFVNEKIMFWNKFKIQF